MRDESDTKSLSVLNFLFGVWLIVSPYILSYSSGQAKWQQTVAGALIALFAAVRYFAVEKLWASWITLIAGIWLVIAPFATNYKSGAAYWNEIIFAVLVILTSIAAGLTHGGAARTGVGRGV